MKAADNLADALLPKQPAVDDDTAEIICIRLAAASE